MTNEKLHEEIYTSLPLSQLNETNTQNKSNSLRYKKNFDIEPNDLAYVKFDQNKYARLNQVHSFLIYTRDGGKYEPKVIIKSINSSSTEHNLTRLQNGSFKCEFIPMDIDEYSIDIYYKNTLITGCPLKCYSFDHLNVKINQILYAFVGKSAKFEVSTKNAGCGELEIAINNGQVKNEVTRLDKFHYLVCFSPLNEGHLNICIKFNSFDVPDGEFSCYCIDLSKIKLVIPHDKPLLYPVDKQISLDIQVDRHLAPNICAYVLNPSGKRTKIKTSSYENDNLMKIHFKTSDVGTHRIEINCLDEKVNEDTCHELKIFDHKRVHIGEIEGLEVGKQCEFTIDSSEAGEGLIEISINNGQTRHQVKQLHLGYYLVSFIPDRQEYYSIDCKFNALQVPGCPKFAFIKEIKPVRIVGEMSDRAGLGRLSSFLVEHVADIKKLSVKITPPSNAGLLIPKITKVSSNRYRIEWIACELGVYLVKVSYANEIISDKSVKIFDPNQIRVTEIHDCVINVQNTFVVDVHGAGEGDLDIAIKAGDMIVANKVRLLANSQFEVSFTPKKLITHYAHISFNGLQICSSPIEFKCRQIAMLKCTGTGLDLVPINRPAKFKVYLDKNEIHRLAVKVHDPEDEVLYTKISPTHDDLLEIEYNPVLIGKHRIQVCHMNAPICGSPFYSHAFDPTQMQIKRIPNELVCDAQNQLEIDMTHVGVDDLQVCVLTENTGDQPRTRISGSWIKTLTICPSLCSPHTIIFKISDIECKRVSLNCVRAAYYSDPSKVILDLASLQMGFVGDEMHSLVDTKKAGPGELTAQCQGPEKPAYCEFIDNKNSTFTLLIKPQQVGRHLLEVRYNGEHVFGSPHAINIENKCELPQNKIKVYGPGISNGMLKDFQSQFYIDTIECGTNGKLSVNVRGPKGKFRVEMKRASLKDRLIQCMYDPREIGQYQVNVQWNGQHVNGSPFKVNIVSNESELKKLLL